MSEILFSHKKKKIEKRERKTRKKRQEKKTQKNSHTLVHQRAEALQHRNVRVRRRRHRRQVPVPRRLEQRLRHLGPVGQRVHEHVDLGAADGLFEVGGALGDGEPFARRRCVALVFRDVGGDVGRGVEDCFLFFF